MGVPTVPCPNPIACLGVESPVANLTAEGPDEPKCFRYAFSEDSTLVCEFDLSLCQAFSNVGSDVGLLCPPMPPGGWPTGPNPPLPVIYSSHEQSCTVECPDFTSETYTVVAGTFVALSQAQADSQAFAFACALAQMQCLGPVPALFTNAAQSCTALCPDNSTLTFTTPAGLFTALSQAEANANAFGFACDVAALLCSGLPPVEIGETAGEPRTAPAAPLWANTAQSCSASCPNGSVYQFVTPGGTFLAGSRGAANAVAFSFACNQANARRACLSDLPSSACLGDFLAEFLSTA